MPESPRHPLFDFVVANLATDLLQLREIGLDPAPWQQRLQELASAGSLDALLAFQQEAWQAPSPPEYPYVEPSDEPTLRSLFPDPGPPCQGGLARLQDKLAGGWLGRAAGCCLGKPLEIGVDRRQAEAICRALNSWPLRDYLNPWPEGKFPQVVPGRTIGGRDRCCTRGLIDHAENDDDLNYPVAALLCLERHGAEWTAPQLFQMIAEITPWGQLWSSGKNGTRAAIMGLAHPGGALFGNPTRQSLGAMIRCDLWGWVAPGNLRLAAEFALRDALFTQTRNGIYAGVFWAVAINAAIAGDDPVAALAVARRTVPPRAKFAEMFDRACELRKTSSWEAAVDEMYHRYGYDDLLPQNMTFNHALINSAITLLAVLFGDGDFSTTVGLAVAGGRDTDCNGATAGSLLGCALGRNRIPEHWIAPLNDRYRSDLAGCHELRISQLAERTVRLAEKHGRFAG